MEFQDQVQEVVDSLYNAKKLILLEGYNQPDKQQLKPKTNKMQLCQGIYSKVLQTVYDTNPAMILEHFAVFSSGTIQHNEYKLYLSEEDHQSCIKCTNAKKKHHTHKISNIIQSTR